MVGSKLTVGGSPILSKRCKKGGFFAPLVKDSIALQVASEVARTVGFEVRPQLAL
jgi:hypothetical protein